MREKHLVQVGKKKTKNTHTKEDVPALAKLTKAKKKKAGAGVGQVD